MNDSHGKSKPTLDSLLKDQQVISGKDLIRRHKEQEWQKALLQEALSLSREIVELRSPSYLPSDPYPKFI